MVEGAGDDPTRGAGPDKVTEAVSPDLDAPPHAQENEPSSSNKRILPAAAA